jgi:hypothetical protein
MVIPIDCPICRDAGMIDSHPYIALLCFQYDENANPIMMFLHLFRIDLVIFLLCFAISIVVRRYNPSSFHDLQT